MKTKFLAVVFLICFSFPAFSKNIAVLPFQNLTQDADKNWIGAGFSETLTTKLSNVNGILMLERTQLSEILKEINFQMAGFVDLKTVVDTGKMYGADVLVLGSYQLMDDILKVNARFVDVETGAVIKAMETSGKLSDIFKLQDEIAFNLAESIEIVLTSEEKIQVSKNPTEDLTAYEWFSNGYEAQILNDNDKAIDYYTKAIELDDHFADAYNNRGVAYKNKGNYDKAIKDYDKAIELNPEDAETYTNRGTAYAHKGNHDKAIKDYDKAIELNPVLTEAYYNRGNAYDAKGNHDKAIKDYSKAIELNPKLAEAYTNRGNAYDDKGNYDKAIKDYDKAIELNPNDAEAYNNRGTAYFKKSNYDKAIKDYDKAIELNPKLAKVYYNRGIAYYGKGNIEKAKENLKKATDLGDSDAREVLKKYFNIDY